MLKFASLGDSAFLIARPTPQGLKIVYRSPQQDKAFGTPYQIGHHETSDRVTDAMTSAIAVYHGDIVVIGTDGLFDNLYDHEILEILDRSARPFAPHKAKKDKKTNLPYWAGNASLVANAIGKEAFGQSISKTALTPYATAASEEFNVIYRGGKKDDLTVLVGFIEASAEEN